MVEVVREPNESTSSVLRRFSKRVQGSGIVRRAKRLKAAERPLSDYKKKQWALKRLARWVEIAHLRKIGKLPNEPFARTHSH